MKINQAKKLKICLDVSMYQGIVTNMEGDDEVKNEVPDIEDDLLSTGTFKVSKRVLENRTGHKGHNKSYV